MRIWPQSVNDYSESELVKDHISPLFSEQSVMGKKEIKTFRESQRMEVGFEGSLLEFQVVPSHN